MSAQTTPPNNCTLCVYHDVQEVLTPDGKPMIGEQQLICRRFPPQLVALQIPRPQGLSVQILPMFPGVNESIWCHEFEAEIPSSGTEDGAQDAD